MGQAAIKEDRFAKQMVEDSFPKTVSASSLCSLQSPKMKGKDGRVDCHLNFITRVPAEVTLPRFAGGHFPVWKTKGTGLNAQASSVPGR